MPGVRGASKACGTCKKRKIGCDLRKPECLRCLKSGLVCEGYAKTSTFVNRNLSNMEQPERDILAVAFHGASKHQCPSGKISRLANVAIKRISPSLSDDSENSVDARDFAVRRATATASLQDCWSLKGTSNSREPMIGLLMKYFVEDGTAEQMAQLYIAISKLHEPTELFDHAVSATALTRRGQLESNNKLIYEGISQYVKTIQWMQAALKNPNTAKKDETLAVCTLMSNFELIAGVGCDGNDPWINHLDGIGQLIRLRGPEKHQTSVGHQIFLHYRTNSAIRVVMTRQCSFLAEPDWCEVPFEKQPKDVFHLLLDPVFKLGCAFEANDRAKVSSPPDDNLRQKIAADCESILSALEKWHNGFTSLFPGGICYATSPSHSMVSEDEKPEGLVFPTYLQFSDVAIAQIMISYWSMFILPYTLGQANYRALDPTFTSPSASEEQSKDYATKIAQSMPYFLQDSLRAARIVMIHPLRVAMQICEHHGMEREYQWCVEMFDEIVEGGMPFVDPEPGIQWVRNEKGDGKSLKITCGRYGSDVLSLEF